MKREKQTEYYHQLAFNKYVGMSVNHLTCIDVIKREGKKQNQLVCKCDCGNICYIFPSFFTHGKQNSCGCLRTQFKTTHGGSKNPLYLEWRSMVARCEVPTSFNYKDYGARGIRVCDEWKNDPFAFYNWVKSVGGRKPGTTLDRIDNNKGYCPENCRFVSSKEQNRNKRSNILIEHDGEVKCLQDWCNIFGVNPETARYRYHQGRTFDEVFSLTPIKYKRRA